MQEPPTFEESVRDDFNKVFWHIYRMEDRIAELEYLVHRLEVKFPEIKEKNCAGCKYLEYGKRVGRERHGEVVPMCTHCPSTYELRGGQLTSLKDTDGCFYWRRRPE